MKTELKNGFAMLIAALLTLSSVAWAEHGPGNGGNAVLMDDGKYYLLDFVEAGIEKQKNIMDERPITWNEHYLPRVRKWAEKDLTMFTPEVRSGIARILERVESTTPNYAAVLYAVIRMHSWRFVEFPLSDIMMDDSSIRISHDKIHQAAIRRSRAILIQKGIWEQMDLLNQIGLVFHEALYALSAVETDASGFQIQRSWHIRQMIPDLFVALTDGDAIQRALRRQSQGKPVLPNMTTGFYMEDSFGWGGDPREVYYGGTNQLSFTWNPNLMLGSDDQAAGIGLTINRLQLSDGRESVLRLCRSGTSPFPKNYEVHETSYGVNLKFSTYDRPEGSYERVEIEHSVHTGYSEGRTFTAQSAEECADHYAVHYQRAYERSRENLLRSIR